MTFPPHWLSAHLSLVAFLAVSSFTACSAHDEGDTAVDAAGDRGPACTTPAPEDDDAAVPSTDSGPGPTSGLDAGGGLPPLDAGSPSLDAGSGGPLEGGPGGQPPDGGTGNPVPNEFGTAGTLFQPDLIVALAQRPSASTILLKTLGGTNGRVCESCHGINTGWTMIPSDNQTRFTTGIGSNGTPNSTPNATAASNDALDPIFRTNDGSNSPNADVSTPASRQRAYSMLLTRSDIRVGLPMPKGAEFELVAVDDPDHFASASQLSLFRRPLPITNVRFLTTVMWDGRQTAPCATLSADLGSQASDAVTGHLKGAPLDESTRGDIVFFERLIYFAQEAHATAGPLDEAGATGGAANLAQQPFYVGMNAFPGRDPRGNAYTRDVFTLFEAWATIPASDPYAAGRASVARGEATFNTRTFDIKGVNGLNDSLGQEIIRGTCSTCHNAPNLGNNSQGLLMATGVSDGANRKPDYPLYTLRNVTTGVTVTTTDPGAALLTGKWSDIGKFKVPGLRGVAAREPLFHDGSAATLADVIDFDDTRFAIGLTDAEKSDLAAFLGAL